MALRRLWPLTLTLACSASATPSMAPADAPAASPEVDDAVNDDTSTASAAPSSDIYLAELDLGATPPRLGKLRNATARDGYDNQPHFVDGTATMLYTSIRAEQADIYSYDLGSGRSTLVHGDPANEYSPTVMPRRRGISLVREQAGVQQLWHYSMDGEDLGPVLEDVVDVGYHAWLSPELLALFILDTEGGRHRLEIVNVADGSRRVVAENIGRCLSIYPRSTAPTGSITFVALAEAPAPSTIMRFDLERGEATKLLETRPGSEDYAWAPDGSLLMAEKNVLHRWTESGGWQVVADLGGELRGEINRLALSEDGRHLALVGVAPAGSG